MLNNTLNDCLTPQYVLPPIGGGDTYVYDTVTTQQKALHMNWGWYINPTNINSYNYDATWFAPDGSWVANPIDESPYNFQYNREMITGFIPTNN